VIQFFKLAGQSVNLFWDLTNAWLMHWGLIPHWAADPSIGNRMINARAETLTELPSFKNIVDRRRCIIPADGFYEWRKEGRSKVPMWVHLKDRKPFGFPVCGRFGASRTGSGWKASPSSRPNQTNWCACSQPDACYPEPRRLGTMVRRFPNIFR
jgi:SOS response associated peptidase (SRAP)